MEQVPIQIPEVVICWDAENCGAKDYYQAALVIQDHVQRMFPNVQVKITAHGNLFNLKDPQIVAWNRLPSAGVKIRHTPGGADAADRAIMVDIFSYARDCRSPSYMMIFSGDGDFIPAIKALHELGHTTIVVHNKSGVNEMLTKSCNHAFWWESLRGGVGFENSQGMANALPLIPSPEIMEVEHSSACMAWDLVTCPIPSIRDDLQAAYARVLKVLGTGEETIFKVQAFRPQGVLRAGNNFGIHYTPISTQLKHLLLENNMIAYLLKFAAQNSNPPCTIVILTGNEKFTEVIHHLRQRGHKVIVFLPSPQGLNDLRNAATMVFDCPDWQKLYD